MKVQYDDPRRYMVEWKTRIKFLRLAHVFFLVPFGFHDHGLDYMPISFNSVFSTTITPTIRVAPKTRTRIIMTTILL